jgi:hypothetical protein
MSLNETQDLAHFPKGSIVGARALEIPARKELEQDHQISDGRETVAGGFAVEFVFDARDHAGGLGQGIGRQMEPVSEPVGLPQARLDPEEGVVARHIRQVGQRQSQPARIEQNIDQ